LIGAIDDDTVSDRTEKWSLRIATASVVAVVVSKYERGLAKRVLHERADYFLTRAPGR
jgi:hypothetical protein